MRNHKLMKLAEKYKRELNEAHVELRDLRARCLTVSDVQVRLLFRCGLKQGIVWQNSMPPIDGSFMGISMVQPPNECFSSGVTVAFVVFSATWWPSVG